MCLSPLQYQPEQDTGNMLHRLEFDNDGVTPPLDIDLREIQQADQYDDLTISVQVR